MNQRTATDQLCACGHRLGTHDPVRSRCWVLPCQCTGFREAWPPTALDPIDPKPAPVPPNISEFGAMAQPDPHFVSPTFVPPSALNTRLEQCKTSGPIGRCGKIAGHAGACLVSPSFADPISLNAEQAHPKPTDYPDLWPLIKADIDERNAHGIAKYGQPLRAFNGRKPLVDAYQEKLDDLVYTRQEIEERKVLEAELARTQAKNAELAAEIDTQRRRGDTYLKGYEEAKTELSGVRVRLDLAELAAREPRGPLVDEIGKLQNKVRSLQETISEAKSARSDAAVSDATRELRREVWAQSVVQGSGVDGETHRSEVKRLTRDFELVLDEKAKAVDELVAATARAEDLEARACVFPGGHFGPCYPRRLDKSEPLRFQYAAVETNVSWCGACGRSTEDHGPEQGHRFHKHRPCPTTAPSAAKPTNDTEILHDREK